MQEQNNNRQQPNENAQQPAAGQQPGQADKRDEMIKNEPDTARIRSERQSVIEGGKKENKEE